MMLYKNIAHEIIRMSQDDDSIREKLLRTGELHGGYHPEMEAIHRQNAKRLREIIAEIGYPTISKVGKVASNSAWLIVQHAIGEPDFMEDCYELLLDNIADINLANLAYLHDRIQFFRSKPQRYGTQLTRCGKIYPVEDTSALNALRKCMDLPPFNHIEIGEIEHVEQIPLLDKENSTYNDWRKKVGWIS
ncbi:MAG: hypothetical protein LBV59_13010 [Sphingobacterium sp.]|uniref:DUF6624 domain-containing protein n=1 Tax=Sphingobacterium sp. TaxID=341027 RepID=UPI002847B0FF|nr:DUF6624 domain-containing protein [Sphingobacterium sp.]MDR3008853.1 hypothetical protein [Sphingobacterium sp.]